MKVRYVGPGCDLSEDLTIGKIYNAKADPGWEGVGVTVLDDVGDETFLIIKERAICPFDEYAEIVEE